MKKSLTNVFQITIKVMLVIIITISSYGILKRTFRNTDVSTNESFKAFPENSIDVIVLGSSQAQYSFSPGLFYKDTGLYSYNLGTQCQQPEVSYQMLKEALKTQSPKAVILEVFTFLPLRSVCKDDGCYVVAAYQMTGQERLDTLAYISEEKAQQYYSDFLSLHNNWRNYEKEEIVERINNTFKKDENPELRDDFFGYVYMDGYYPKDRGNNWFPNIYEEYEEVELEPLHLESLNKIYDLCKENNIELILYKTPMDGIDVLNYSYLKKIWEWAEEHDVSYYDLLTKSSLLQLKINIHSDSFHSNVDGAGVMTHYIANKINEYDFEHSEIDYLSNIYSEGGSYIFVKYLDYETDPNIYLPALESFKGYLLIRYNPDNQNTSEELYERLTKIVKTEFDRNTPQIFLLHDSEVIMMDDYLIETQINGIEVFASTGNIYFNDKRISTDNLADIIYLTDKGTSPIVKGISNDLMLY